MLGLGCTYPSETNNDVKLPLVPSHANFLNRAVQHIRFRFVDGVEVREDSFEFVAEADAALLRIASDRAILLLRRLHSRFVKLEVGLNYVPLRLAK